MTRVIRLLALAALASCSSKPEPQASASAIPASEADHATPRCGDAIAVSIDGKAFDTGAETPFPPSRLARLRGEAARSFHDAAAAACAKLPKARGELAHITSLAVVPGAGATEPVFFQDEERSPRLNFQYAFIESDLSLPKQTETDLALRCWVDPNRNECLDEGD